MTVIVEDVSFSLIGSLRRNHIFSGHLECMKVILLVLWISIQADRYFFHLASILITPYGKDGILFIICLSSYVPAFAWFELSLVVLAFVFAPFWQWDSCYKRCQFSSKMSILEENIIHNMKWYLNMLKSTHSFFSRINPESWYQEKYKVDEVHFNDKGAIAKALKAINAKRLLLLVSIIHCKFR